VDDSPTPEVVPRSITNRGRENDLVSQFFGPARLMAMGILAASAELWAAAGTTITTVVLLVPGIVYAWYVFEDWIDDDDSYTKVIASLEREGTDAAS
jgi:hypothetical protein